MVFDPLKVMEHTIAFKEDSEHKQNPIAASITGTTKTGEPFQIIGTNYYPQAITAKIGKGVKIGNASPTVHAETGLLHEIIATEGKQSAGAHLYVTDPTCVNCAKNAIEAGITKVFIDTAGYDGDFNARRGDDFKYMALPMYKAAGVQVFDVDRAAQTVTKLFELPPNSIRPKFSEVAIKPYEGKLSKKSFKKYVAQQYDIKTNSKRQVFVMATGNVFEGWSILSTGPSIVAGYDETTEKSYISEKYTAKLEPLNKTMMTMARHGMTPHKDYIFSAQVPTSRELVDIVGAGYRRIFIGNKTKARDKNGLQALKQLEEHQILEVLSL